MNDSQVIDPQAPSATPAFDALPYTCVGDAMILTATGRLVQDALDADGYTGTHDDIRKMISDGFNVWERYEGDFEIYLSDQERAYARYTNYDGHKPSFGFSGTGNLSGFDAMMFGRSVLAIVEYIASKEQTA